MTDIQVKKYRSGFYKMEVRDHPDLINCIKVVCPYMADALNDMTNPIRFLYIESHEFVEICQCAEILGYQFLVSLV